MTRLALLVPFAALVLLAGRGRGGAYCFNISDHGEAIRKLAGTIEKVAHVPVQKWEGWDMTWLNGLFPESARLKGQDFDLGDALADPTDVTQKPIPPNKKPTHNDDDGFNLEDAFGVDDPKKPEPPAPPQPNPGSHGNTGDFSDLDLNDGQAPAEPPKGGHGGSDSGGKEQENPGMIAGIISSVLVAIAGAVSSFVAYQKKKLCFKASDEENVNMQSQQGAHSEPPVQRTLLQKQ
ncbi:CD99 antigen isoform X2 [Zootoca vivipara]|uniref:CD99 antigen isoform X2 n=1 Tax=Zootoca vivipara TaxID=8524 RepID=UPI00293B8FE1|nr:CD99 antigen isoform X2 [Zootoca vivipara]